jgi:hypothetical protein
MSHFWLTGMLDRLLNFSQLFTAQFEVDRHVFSLT